MGRKVHAYDRTTFSSNAVKMQNTPWIRDADVLNIL